MSKKSLTKWLAIALALALVLGFAVSCEDPTNDNNNNNTGGGDIPTGLVGTWTGGNGATMIINANGSGSFKMMADMPAAMDATYSATETTLTIKIAQINANDTFSYSISDKQLTLTTDVEAAKQIANLSPFTKS